MLTKIFTNLKLYCVFTLKLVFIFLFFFCFIQSYSGPTEVIYTSHVSVLCPWRCRNVNSPAAGYRIHVAVLTAVSLLYFYILLVYVFQIDLQKSQVPFSGSGFSYIFLCCSCLRFCVQGCSVLFRELWCLSSHTLFTHARCIFS